MVCLQRMLAERQIGEHESPYVMEPCQTNNVAFGARMEFGVNCIIASFYRSRRRCLDALRVATAALSL